LDSGALGRGGEADEESVGVEAVVLRLLVVVHGATEPGVETSDVAQ
jgi:hypothetical protein